MKVIQKPLRRVITVGNKHYFLSFPKMKFETSLRKDPGLQDFSLNKFIVSLHLDGKYVKLSFLPNITVKGNVCLGKITRKRYKTEARAKKLLQEALEAFWSLRFNKNWEYCNDFFRNIVINNEMAFPKIEDYLQYWQQKTKEDRNWIPDKEFFGGQIDAI